MTGPEDQLAASPPGRGRGYLRASDTDRDQAVDVLKAAFVRGLLAKDEFVLRVGRVLRARTYADLDALTTDLRAGLARQGQQPASPPDRRRVPAPVVIAQLAWTRRRLLVGVAGTLLLVLGMTLASPVAFIAGLLILGASAPQAVPWTSETARVHTWQWLDRGRANHL